MNYTKADKNTIDQLMAMGYTSFVAKPLTTALPDDTSSATAMKFELVPMKDEEFPALSNAYMLFEMPGSEHYIDSKYLRD